MRIRNEERASQLAGIAEQFGLADIYVFGSRADELLSSSDAAFHSPDLAESDVDIAIRPRRGITFSPQDRVELTLALERALAVPNVDLVVLPEASPFLALAAIRGHLLFCADALDQAEYELFVLRRAGDLAPLERERQQIILSGGR